MKIHNGAAKTHPSQNESDQSEIDNKQNLSPIIQHPEKTALCNPKSAATNVQRATIAKSESAINSRLNPGILRIRE